MVDNRDIFHRRGSRKDRSWGRADGQMCFIHASAYGGN